MTAKRYLEEALEGNHSDKRLNFQYAELQRTTGCAASKDLLYYYRRAFTKWDRNYDSQFWYARYAFESTDEVEIRESKEIFRRLREVGLPYRERSRIRDAVGGLESPREFFGTIARLEAAHAFVALDGRGDWLFFHETDAEVGWSELVVGERVSFQIGFNMRGPKAIRVRLARVVSSAPTQVLNQAGSA